MVWAGLREVHTRSVVEQWRMAGQWCIHERSTRLYEYAGEQIRRTICQGSWGRFQGWAQIRTGLRWVRWSWAQSWGRRRAVWQTRAVGVSLFRRHRMASRRRDV